eukprot:CAMPEP_0184521572 /NCGR_PEP_ID=MMETSP0198_2-20121128/7774_1 /TAXON_ID=1112570 /ORGANISM="Thraustochytrium sp., Strain LLF1b" /LENGTH=51 /DNA_ID=CAMNT_0026912249 /DNA_START=203 /DNA_END=358 /DNA_ORIENTATION=-
MTVAGPQPTVQKEGCQPWVGQKYTLEREGMGLCSQVSMRNEQRVLPQGYAP